MIAMPVHGIAHALHDGDRAVEEGGNFDEQRLPAEQERRELVEEQDQAECRQHLVEVVARIQLPDDEIFHQHARGARGDEPGGSGEHERARLGRDERHRIGADHVERAMGEIDHAHDAEDQRQAGGQQEQHDAELHAVQRLFDQEGHSGSRRLRKSGVPSRRHGRDCPGRAAIILMKRWPDQPRPSRPLLEHARGACLTSCSPWRRCRCGLRGSSPW